MRYHRRRPCRATVALPMTALAVWAGWFVAGVDPGGEARGEPPSLRPNILLCIADDWGWPDAGAYGNRSVKTPAFDRVAREGVLFEHAFVTSPSCTPSRNSILTGQHHWRLGAGVNLWSSLAPEHPVYPLLLADAGYHVGHWRKAWGPGDFRALGRTENPAGPATKGLRKFLSTRPAKAPFCFWLGSSDPHRPYAPGSGKQAGIDPAGLRVPSDLPDHEIVRSDLADYLFEVERFDRDVAAALAVLEEFGELDTTIVVITGDHGMPFPRHKCHLYDSGTRVPLAIRWPAMVKPGRVVSDFVSLADLAPTFLEAAGLKVPGVMTGRTMLPLLAAEGSGRIDPARDGVLTGRERHTPAQEAPSTAGYPSRAIRTDDYLYIRNYEPDRWPSGCPTGSTKGRDYADCDASPTKRLLIEHRDRPEIRPFFLLAFAKRPAEEFYLLASDPGQTMNLAGDPAHAKAQEAAARRLAAGLEATDDPRARGEGSLLEEGRYFGEVSSR